MGDTQKSLICPVCAKPCVYLWGHVRKSGDPAHREHEAQVRQEVLELFASKRTSEEVALKFGFHCCVVQEMWRTHYGKEATASRSQSLHCKTLPTCVCGQPVKHLKSIYCSRKCYVANHIVSEDSKRKQSQAMSERVVSAETRKRLSDTMKKQAQAGTLSTQRPEVRAKQSATKKLKGLPKVAFDAFMAKTTHEERQAAGHKMQARTLEKYGVTHTYQIPGLADRANNAKSESWAKRMAAGIVTNNGKQCFKRGWHESPIAGTQWFQSSWEHLFMLRLDCLGLLWSKNHGIRITYANENEQPRNYVPDFKVEVGEQTYLVEVKGYPTPEVPVKHAAAETFCLERGWQFVVLTTEKSTRTWSPDVGLLSTSVA